MKTIVVLGMHRSGTSAITGAIGRLGAETGPPERLQPLWENYQLRRFNIRLLALGGGTWDGPPPAQWLDQPAVRALLDPARDLITDQFGDAPTAVWKDPRTCLTMPFWRDVLDEDPVYVLIYRHPDEVAASLTTRNAFGPGHAHALWERYNADALRYATGSPTVVLEYSHLVTEPVQALQLIVDTCTDAGATLPNDPATTDHGLIPQERHHLTDTPDTLDPIATTSQHDLFTLLRAVQGAHPVLALPSPPPEPHPLSTELLATAGALRTLRRQRKHERDQDKAARTGRPVRRTGRRRPEGMADGTADEAAASARAQEPHW